MIYGPVDYEPWLTGGTNEATGTGFYQSSPSCDGTPVVITSATPDNILCGEPSGSILLTWSGGTANYDITWTGGGSATGITGSPYNISGLAAGTYTITVTDANSSSDEIIAEVQYLPVTNVTDGLYYATIQDAIDATTTDDGEVIEVCAGTYIEDLEVDKSLTLLGPNAGISPNNGTRVAEAIILPSETNAAQAYITASAVTIDGFTFNGDNIDLTSGFLEQTVQILMQHQQYINMQTTLTIWLL
jgi:hypothetical protein